MHHVACLGRGKGTKLQKKKLKTSIGNWLRYNHRRASLDESAKQLLSNLVVQRGGTESVFVIVSATWIFLLCENGFPADAQGIHTAGLWKN